MKKTVIILLGVIFALLYLFNYLSPMFFGDDYVYSFVWEGHSLYEPLTEKAIRIASWKDLFCSQWLHYFTWSGRTVNHLIAQFFLWKGKSVFNFFNAMISTLLVMEIYWCAHKGIITKKINTGLLCWIFFAVWSFTPGFGTVFFWLDAACNYLWPAVIVVGFLIPYFRKYYYFSEKQNKGNGIRINIVMFLFGVFAGWTNENTICWLILVLVVFIYTHKNNNDVEKWMYCGLAGLITGYALLLCSPGNLARLYMEQNRYNWFMLSRIKEQTSFLVFVVFYFQIFLWYFNLRSLYILRKRNKGNNELEKEIMLTTILCIVSFGMTAVMVFSPSFPPRSGFPGTIYLIIATSLLLRLQSEYGITLIQNPAKYFLTCICVLYFGLTLIVSFNHTIETYRYNEEIVSFVEQLENKDVVIEVKKPFKPTLKDQIMSAYHIISLEISENENEWKNVSFARYYGIKGIRVVKKKIDKDEDDSIIISTIPATLQSR